MSVEVNSLAALSVIPSGAALGAEVRGLDLSRPLASATVSAVRDALLKHGVVLFREQVISELNQVDFTAYFGKPEVHLRSNPDEVTPGIFLVSNVLRDGKPIGALGHGEVGFHSDLAYMPKPGTFTCLHALEIPASGGNTQWSSGYAAYAALAPEMQATLRGLRAIHRHVSEALNLAELTDHPVVCTHPETGRKTLFVTPLFTDKILGVPQAQGVALLATLIAHVTQPQFIWTHEWRQGDLVMWDNRATMHRREPFPSNLRRVMNRTQIYNDTVPVA